MLSCRRAHRLLGQHPPFNARQASRVSSGVRWLGSVESSNCIAPAVPGLVHFRRANCNPPDNIHAHIVWKSVRPQGRHPCEPRLVKTGGTFETESILSPWGSLPGLASRAYSSVSICSTRPKLPAKLALRPIEIPMMVLISGYEPIATDRMRSLPASPHGPEKAAGVIKGVPAALSAR